MHQVQKAVGDSSTTVNIALLLQVLGVSEVGDLEVLIKYLTGTSELPANAEEIEIDADTICSRLKSFVEAHQNKLSQQIGKSATMAAPNQSELRKQADKAYWDRMAHVVSDKVFRVWVALEKSMKQYHDLLTTRWNKLGENRALQKQNQELRELLSQYLSSKVNEELQIPPTSLIWNRMQHCGFDKTLRTVDYSCK